MLNFPKKEMHIYQEKQREHCGENKESFEIHVSNYTKSYLCDLHGKRVPLSIYRKKCSIRNLEENSMC